jgi:hypothetical protein
MHISLSSSPEFRCLVTLVGMLFVSYSFIFGIHLLLAMRCASRGSQRKELCHSHTSARPGVGLDRTTKCLKKKPLALIQTKRNKTKEEGGLLLPVRKRSQTEERSQKEADRLGAERKGKTKTQDEQQNVKRREWGEKKWENEIQPGQQS